jgi:hypothetical protein
MNTQKWSITGEIHNQPDWPDGFLVSSDADGRIIAAVFLKPGTKDTAMIRETAANALLVAAAPDLLEALKFFLTSLENGKRSGLTPARDLSDWNTVDYTARAALAKAEGKQP